MEINSTNVNYTNKYLDPKLDRWKLKHKQSRQEIIKKGTEHPL